LAFYLILWRLNMEIRRGSLVGMEFVENQ